jgi:arylsulfatase A-like enzyme
LDPYRRNVSPHRVVRSGRWKYLDEASGGQYLFDVAGDVGEQHNLSDAQPELTDRLRRRLDAWEAEVDPPLYDQRPPRAERPDK